MSPARVLFCVLAAGGAFVPARALGQQPPPTTGPAVIPAPPAVPLPAPPATEPAPPATAPPPPAQAPPPAPPTTQPPPPPAGPPPENAPPAYPAPANPPPAYPPGAYPAPPGYAPPGYAPPGYAPPPGYPYRNPYPPARPPGAETHDGGYIRLQLGLGWTGISASGSSNVVEYSGGSGSLAAAFGFSVHPRLILYVELLNAGTGETDRSLNGGSAERISPKVGTNVGGIGPGAATYFGANLFVAATILFATVQLNDSNGNVLEKSKTGLAFEALFGKEWWVSDNWGLGVSGQVVLGRMQGKDVDITLVEVPTWSTKSFSVLFSATYN